MTQSFRLPFLLACGTVGGLVVWLKAAAPDVVSAVSSRTPTDATSAALGEPVPQRGGPGGESLPQTGAATWEAVWRELLRRGRPSQAQTLGDVCKPAPGSCACETAALRAVLDLGGATPEAEVSLPHRSCVEAIGARAEWFALRGRSGEAKKLAEVVAASSAGYGEAQMALGRVELEHGHLAPAAEFFERARLAGRGTPALLESFQLRLRNGDRSGAQQLLTQMPQGHPDSLYCRALLAQFDDEYGTARSTYLELLAIDPGYANARFQLGLLTHSVGATSEARHNLERLQAMVGPSDPRSRHLGVVLAGPPAPLRGRFVFSTSPDEGDPPEQRVPSRASTHRGESSVLGKAEENLERTSKD